MGLCVVGPVGLVGLWVWWWARGPGGPGGHVELSFVSRWAPFKTIILDSLLQAFIVYWL